MVNSPLREEPREQRAAVIRSRHETSLLDWLESSGRLIARVDVQEASYLEADDDTLGLIDSDDVTYDLDDDDEPLELDEPL